MLSLGRTHVNVAGVCVFFAAIVCILIIFVKVNYPCI